MFDAYRWPQYSDFWLSIVSCIFIGVAQNLFQKTFYGFFYRVCKETQIEELRQQKARKSTENCFKSLYFLTTVVGGTYVLRQRNFLP